MDAQLVSKGEFASIINVSPGRVSQFIAAGQITAAAIVGYGQRAKIDVERARADLRLTLDVGQRLGNGSETRLDADPIAPQGAVSETITAPPEVVRGPDHEIKLQKLEQLRRVNRNGAIADAKTSGLLMETSDGRAQMSKIAAAMLVVFEGGLNDMATAVAAQFQLPQRDVKHLIKAEFRKVREIAAQTMKEKAVTMEERTMTELDAEEVEVSDLTD